MSWMAVKNRQSFRAQHPFVTVCRDKVRMHGLSVKRQGTQALNGVHTKQYAAPVTSFTETVQVHADAAGVLHRTCRQQTRVAVHRGEQGRLGILRIAELDNAGLYAVVG